MSFSARSQAHTNMAEESKRNDSRSMKHGKWYWVDKTVIQERARKDGLLTIAVYHFLASMADENQTCYPSQKYVAKKMGCSRGSVNRAIKRLAEDKLISMWKTSGKRTVYHLLPVGLSINGTGVSGMSTPDVSGDDTNNNKGTRSNNNEVVPVHKTYNATDEPDSVTEIQSKQELLARDIAEALGDHDHFSIYLSCAERYTESFLRRVLAETKLTPDRKIRKSRAALFNFLINHYAGK